MKRETIHMRVSPILKKRIASYAAKKGETITDIIKSNIESILYKDEIESLYRLYIYKVQLPLDFQDYDQYNECVVVTKDEADAANMAIIGCDDFVSKKQHLEVIKIGVASPHFKTPCFVSKSYS